LSSVLKPKWSRLLLQQLIRWYCDWEDEILAVLANPEMADTVAPGYRRRMAQKLAAMSPIERQQLREFSLTYQGRKGWIAFGKLILLFCLMGVALHFALPTKYGLVESLFLSNLLGLSTAFGFVSLWFNYRRLRPPGLKSFLIIAGLAMAGALVGGSTVTLVDSKPLVEHLEKIGRVALIAGLIVAIVYTAIHSVVAGWRNREYELLTAQLQLQAQQESMARQISESKLRLLQAQIEPHFLFNTLGAVQQLAQTECPAAADLTANLITFLRASLTEMRNEQVTLASEFQLVEAYLKVMKTRLAHRLEFALDLPSEFATVKVPGMLLLTLVENAVKHGIEPSLQGGSIKVRVWRYHSSLRLDVLDSGIGLSVNPPVGVGIANVQERLRLAYGVQASCSLENIEPHGVLATVNLPNVPLLIN
jgi:two-component sensor histidine kinase